MNVIVIMLDSLRPDHLGCYGNPWIETPNIDSFAKECAVFDRAYAEGMPTLPVRTALFTGRYTLPYKGWGPLELGDVTLAEVLWDKGYRTMFVSDTYHMHKPGMGYSRGFDIAIWIRGQEADPYITDPAVKVDLNRWHEKNYSVSPESSPYHGIKAFVQYLKNTHWWRNEENHFVARVMKTAAKLLEDSVNSGIHDKIFLWIDSFDPHEPWDPPREYYEKYAPPGYDGKPIIFPSMRFAEEYTLLEIQHIRAQYAGEVTLVDRWVGWFLDRVRELGLWENTLIILLSDHGEPLGEHGIVRKVYPWPYEELSKVVLMIRHPEGIGKGKRITSFAETVDVMPTILDFLDVKLGEKISPWSVEPKIQGTSLAPLIAGELDSVKPFAISGHYRRSLSIRDEEFTLYLWPTPGAEYQWGLGPIGRDSGKRKPELYKSAWNYIPPPPKDHNWKRDVPEKEDLYEEEKDIAKELELKLKNKLLSLLGYS